MRGRFVGALVLMAFIVVSGVLLFGWCVSFVSDRLGVFLGSPVLLFSADEIFARADEVIALSSVMDGVYLSLGVVGGVLLLWGVLSVGMYVGMIRLLAGKKAKGVWRAVVLGVGGVVVGVGLLVGSFVVGRGLLPAVVFVVFGVFLLTILPVFMISVSCCVEVYQVLRFVFWVVPWALLVLAGLIGVVLVAGFFVPVWLVQVVLYVGLVVWLVWCHKVVVEGVCVKRR